MYRNMNMTLILLVIWIWLKLILFPLLTLDNETMRQLPYLNTRYRLLCISNSRKRGSLNLWEGVWWWDFKWTKTHRYNVPHCLAIYFASQSKCIRIKENEDFACQSKILIFLEFIDILQQILNILFTWN